MRRASLSGDWRSLGGGGRLDSLLTEQRDEHQSIHDADNATACERCAPRDFLRHPATNAAERLSHIDATHLNPDGQ